MADQTLKFRLEIDAQTGSLKIASDELGKVEQHLRDLKPAASDAGGAMDSIGRIVKGIGLANLLGAAAHQALETSQALQEMQAALTDTTGAILKELEPALKFVSNGIQGLLLTIRGSIGVFKDLARGEWAKAWDEILTVSGDAEARIAGITKQTLDDQIETIRLSAQLAVRNEKIGREERLRIVDAAEKKDIAMTQETAAFKAADADKQANILLQKQLDYQEMRRRLVRTDLGEERELHKAATDAQLQDVEQATAERLALEASTVGDRLRILEDGIAQEKDILDRARSTGYLSEAQYNQAIIDLKKRSGAQVAKVVLDDKLREKKLRDQIGQEIIGIERAIGGRLVDMAYEAGEKGKANSRDFAREMVKTAAQGASQAILAYGAAAATKASVDAAGGGPLAVAATFAATYAPFVALAAGVAALGGIAVRAIGGAEGGGAPAGGGSKPSDYGGGGGYSPAAADVGGSGAPAPAAGGPRQSVSITINTMGEIPSQVTREIEDILVEAGRR